MKRGRCLTVIEERTPHTLSARAQLATVRPWRAACSALDEPTSSTARPGAALGALAQKRILYTRLNLGAHPQLRVFVTELEVAQAKRVNIVCYKQSI